MCFNPHVSLATYMIGTLGSFLLYKHGRIPEALFYAWVVQMQLVELLLWKSQDCSQTNVDVSKAGIIINHLEPVMLWLAIPRTLPVHVQLLMGLYLAATAWYTRKVFTETQCTTVTPDSAPHLYWRWNEGVNAGPYYGLFLATLVCLSVYGLPSGHLNAMVVLVSFALSYYIYRDKHTVGSMWCFAAAFAPWALLGLYQ